MDGAKVNYCSTQQKTGTVINNAGSSKCALVLI